MEKNPEQFASFYTTSNLGFDLQMVQKGYEQYKRYFTGKTCLEIGPATGYMTKLLINDFEHLTIVEGSKTLLLQIPDFPNLEKHHSLIEDFHSPVCYDTIILNHVLEHIAEPVTVLELIRTWLKPGGRLIVGVPNAKSFHRLAAVKMGLLQKENALNSRDLELGHYRVYDFELLRSHMAKAGYQIIEEGGIFLKFLSNSQIESFLDQNIINAYFQLGDQFKENSAEIFIVATL